jgi:hypothetical protein
MNAIVRPSVITLGIRRQWRSLRHQHQRGDNPTVSVHDGHLPTSIRDGLVEGATVFRVHSLEASGTAKYGLLLVAGQREPGGVVTQGGGAGNLSMSIIGRINPKTMTYAAVVTAYERRPRRGDGCGRGGRRALDGVVRRRSNRPLPDTASGASAGGQVGPEHPKLVIFESRAKP